MTRSTPPAGLLTIVSANYLPFARVLCRSVAEHEPDVRRFVVVVDRNLDEVLERHEPFEAIDVRDLGIPDVDDFLAQYTVLEANTAVKPFALNYLFERHALDRAVYLDPDIWVHSALDAVWESLEAGAVVLTPHLRDPFCDESSPAEVDILRSGTYNLGFVALRRGAESRRLLDWWAQKTTCDCVVDIPNGLFVDQKWMDLVPGYCDGTVILRHPAYNVAYWNLHERELSVDGGSYRVDGERLAFFHFSGYDPDRPDVLSKHQTRHDLRSMPAVQRLCRAYSAKLFAEGYTRAKGRVYGYGTLANGIPVSRFIRKTVRRCRKERLAFPSVDRSDDLCRFLMTPNAEIAGRDVSPFTDYVLEERHDVARAYPNAVNDAQDLGFLGWLANSSYELPDEMLYRRFAANLTRDNAFARIRRLYERRADLQSAYPEAFRSFGGLEEFATWLNDHGRNEEDISTSDVETFVDSGRSGFSRVLDLYLTMPDVALAFPAGLLPWANADFRDFLLRNGMRLGRLSTADICWFQHRAEQVDPSELLLLTALRSHWIRERLPLAATVLGWGDALDWARAEGKKHGVEAPSLSRDLPPRMPAIAQLELIQAAQETNRDPAALRTRGGAKGLADTALRPFDNLLTEAQRVRLQTAVENYAPSRGVNIAGHFHYAGGVASAAESMVLALDAAGIRHHDITLPVAPSRMTAPHDGSAVIPERLWTLHRPDFGIDVTVANADVMPAVRAYLGRCYGQGRKHVAYWVWETDRLPGRYASAAEDLDAIWTPSEHSARALRATLGDARPIEVLPYAMSVTPIVDPRPLPVTLPDDRKLLGFFFDARSVVERKNPMALLRAFRAAFRSDDDVTLVLKVNHDGEAREEMRALERAAEGLPVVWLRDVRLDASQVRALLSRLDMYVSLHRAEGFGLVLAEAMALGKPVVATRYSGNLEFMDDSSARLIGCREIVTDRSYGPYPRGTRWAEPDIEEAAEAMRTLVRDASARADFGSRARARIERDLSPWVIGNRLQALLEWRSSEGVQPALRGNGAGSSTLVDVAPAGALRKGLPWSLE